MGFVVGRNEASASDELHFAPLDPTEPFTPIALEGFKSPTGPAQDDEREMKGFFFVFKRWHG